MSLYLEQKLTSPDPLGIHLSAEFHAREPAVAVASYSQARGGYVTVFDADSGDAVNDIGDPEAQVTAIRWHPILHLLATCWDSGRVRLWKGSGQFDDTDPLHRAAVNNVEWDGASRLITVDAAGCLVAWKLDSQGLQCSFVVDLAQPCCTLLVRAVVAPDVTGLARAAVAGDNAALDLFSDWRPRTTARLPLPGTVPESPGIFACCRDSTFHVGVGGACVEACSHDDGLRHALLSGNTLVTLSEALALTHFTVGTDGALTAVTAVKLGGRGREASLAWASPGVVAVTTGELSVRLWDLSTGDSELLEPTNPSAGHAFTCLAAANGELAAGTNLGGVWVWHVDPGGMWGNETSAQLRGSCKQISWRDGTLLVNASSSTYMLHQHVGASSVGLDMQLLQVSGRQVEAVLSSGETLSLGTDIQVLGLSSADGKVVARGRHAVAVYQLASNAFDAVASFPCRAQCAHAVSSGIVLMEEAAVTLRTSQGQVIQTLGGASEEGQPITCEVSGAFVTVATDAGFLRLWQIGRRDASLVCPAKNLEAELSDFGEVIDARSDCQGTKVCVSFASAALVPDSRLVLWVVEPNVLHLLDLAAEAPPRFPLSFRWDQSEPSLLFCVAKLRPVFNGKQPLLSGVLPDQRKASSATITLTPTPSSLLRGLFATERGFSDSESSPLAEGRSLAGLRAPLVFLLVDGEARLESRPMAMLDGLESCDAETRKALVAFTRLLSIGQSERAFAAIRAVNGAWVWRRLAASCAAAGQLDAAALCLGRAGLARAARHLRLRRTQTQGTVGARRLLLGAVAEQLGAAEEAAKIYREAGHKDLLHGLLIAQGRWDEALAECSESNRVRLRTTHHARGRCLELEGEREAAARHYALAGTAARHVPRMLSDQPDELAAFLDNPDMQGWKGQYLESCGQLEDACATYRECGDHLSLVRVLCFQGALVAAGEEASKSGHRAACYHVARQHEALDQPEFAVRFYTLAKALGSAARICMEHDWSDQLWALTQLPGSTRPMMLQAATWFERHGQSARAVTLFHRGGATERAVHLALSTHDLDALDKMAADLGANNALTTRCADTFVKEGRFQQAVALYAQAHEPKRAIALCEQHNVLVTDELAAQLLPDNAGQKPDPALLIRFAELAQSQAAFQLAARLLTRAGRKVEAMKSLLKSGDTDKVIFFANVCRQREVYVMAANHLQALDWTTQPKILDTIVTFYTKGRAPALLASFYESCARREADEFGDYEKALAALGESQRCQSAQRTAESITLIKRFLEIRAVFSRGDTTTAASQCRQLLNALAQDSIVRRGDVLALLVQACAVTEPEAARAAVVQIGSGAARYLPAAIFARFAPPVLRKPPLDDGDLLDLEPLP